MNKYLDEAEQALYMAGEEVAAGKPLSAIDCVMKAVGLLIEERRATASPAKEEKAPDARPLPSPPRTMAELHGILARLVADGYEPAPALVLRATLFASGCAWQVDSDWIIVATNRARSSGYAVPCAHLAQEIEARAVVPAKEEKPAGTEPSEPFRLGRELFEAIPWNTCSKPAGEWEDAGERERRAWDNVATKLYEAGKASAAREVERLRAKVAAWEETVSVALRAAQPGSPLYHTAQAIPSELRPEKA